MPAKDPDLYVHIVARKDDGIIVTVAKSHITGAVNSHGLLIMPTTAMKETDTDYAVCFYVPVDAPRGIHIFGRQTNATRNAVPAYWIKAMKNMV